MQDILFIDKPKGITSFDVIRILRKKLGIRKMGHAGTLDPQASGLLIIGINQGTKKLNDYLKLPKTYLMNILLGKKSATGDTEGKIIEEKKVKKINIEKVKQIFKEMERELELKVPLYSAVKIKGKPLYKYAREGKKISSPKRKMEIFSLKLLGIKKENEYFLLKTRMDCQKGTYARSVAEEIGERLNFPAMLKDLRRIKIGKIDIKQAKKIKTF